MVGPTGLGVIFGSLESPGSDVWQLSWKAQELDLKKTEFPKSYQNASCICSSILWLLVKIWKHDIFSCTSNAVRHVLILQFLVATNTEFKMPQGGWGCHWTLDQHQIAATRNTNLTTDQTHLLLVRMSGTSTKSFQNTINGLSSKTTGPPKNPTGCFMATQSISESCPNAAVRCFFLRGWLWLFTPPSAQIASNSSEGLLTHAR